MVSDLEQQVPKAFEHAGHPSWLISNLKSQISNPAPPVGGPLDYPPMSDTFHCSIVTPTKKVFDGAVRYVSFPAWDGQHGVMMGQSPLLSSLAIGPVRVDLPGGESRWWLLEGGFAQVDGGALTLLTSRATPASELSAEQAETDLAAAAARIATAGAELPQVERDQQRALAQKAMARSHA